MQENPAVKYNQQQAEMQCAFIQTLSKTLHYTYTHSRVASMNLSV